MGSKCSAKSLSWRSLRLTNGLQGPGLDPELCQHSRDNPAVQAGAKAWEGKNPLTFLPGSPCLGLAQIIALLDVRGLLCSSLGPQDVPFIGILAAVPMDPTKISLLHHYCRIQDLFAPSMFLFYCSGKTS